MWEGWVSDRRSWGSARPLPLLFFPAREKVINGNCEQGCEGKSNSEEVDSKWLKGGFPYISAQGCIIIPKVNIYSYN